VNWQGAVFLDTVAQAVVDYPVKCKNTQTVDNQPLTLALSTDKPEFTFPNMRPITSECDPRGVTRWSTSYFVPNGRHLTGLEDSRTYVGRMFSVLKGMIEAMRQDGSVDSAFLDAVKNLVQQAEAPFSSQNWTQQQAAGAMTVLDNATLLVLEPPDGDPYSPTAETFFPNPEGELASHLAAARYAVCSELAYPGNLGECTMDESVVAALPELPQPLE
jgi:hypothetical protein